MALSEFERIRIERAAEGLLSRRRPPPHIRSEIDIAYRISNQSLEIFEIRPQWDDPSRTMEHAIAKATFVKATGQWKVYWQRADLNWHRYDPKPEVETVEDFLNLVDADEYACFFG